MGLSSSVGNASSFLNGIQAKRVSFNDPCAEISGPCQQSLAFFWRTRLLFYRCCTDDYSLRRWNSGGGTAARHCRSLDVSLEQFSFVQVGCGAGDGPPIARRWEKRPTRCDPKCGQRVGPQISWLETYRLDAEFDSCALESGSLETSMLETDLLTVESEAGALETDLLTVESEAGVLENDQLTAVLEVRASARRRRVGLSQRVRRAALRAGALFRPVG